MSKSTARKQITPVVDTYEQHLRHLQLLGERSLAGDNRQAGEMDRYLKLKRG
jgi:hypothetical protein